MNVFANEYKAPLKREEKKNKVVNETTEGEKDGITILEALSATGLRSIRYAKEITNVKNIIANDISAKAEKDIQRNIKLNNVEKIVESSCDDAV